ncbi:E3 ubiquitin-protein ligase PUB23-like [Henckelia pumila]|uniref:E3 ubiquitin-protein ligase PUB23-like n=1 Tax=Henckelia pumila TaxID=405737 RepID=UPI003C6E89D2
MDIPEDFRCPISMELMKDPVTISTGVTYDRKNIHKWFHTYKKTTCPATMQELEVFDMTPNHTLKNLMFSWFVDRRKPCYIVPVSTKHDELVSILAAIESTPFKVSCLRKLRDILETSDEYFKEDFKASGGVESMVKIITQISAKSWDFAAFRACEEAVGVLNQFPFSEDDERILRVLMRPECMKSMAVMLRRGGSEARFCTISVFRKISRSDQRWNVDVAEGNGIDFFKTLLEILSDESCTTKASSCSLQVLVGILDSSKKSRLKSIEAGGICTLVELLPESKRWRCEKMMHLIKLMCGCAEGRLALVEHGMGIAAVSKKLMDESNLVTKIGVKIFWLILNSHASERVLEEMLVCGAVGRLVSLLHVDGGGGVGGQTTERVVKILKLHGGRWRRHPCFPSEFKNYMGS